jgi:hypothetical protein
VSWFKADSLARVNWYSRAFSQRHDVPGQTLEAPVAWDVQSAAPSSVLPFLSKGLLTWPNINADHDTGSRYERLLAVDRCHMFVTILERHSPQPDWAVVYIEAWTTAMRISRSTQIHPVYLVDWECPGLLCAPSEAAEISMWRKVIAISPWQNSAKARQSASATRLQPPSQVLER